METTIIGYILGLYWGYIGIMENKMETTIHNVLGLYRGMEKKMAATIGYVMGLYGWLPKLRSLFGSLL